ncbi:type IV pilus modification PilV family protein [Bacillus sp. DJP31]|uniref:type IV pilus modification PilV family protein n=1 Tax=Bacillus sp. DJP31 TaxID=3409789 RepID=UPI003BB7199F
MIHFINKKEKGFTLLEVLVSITILSVVMITLLAFFTQSYSYTNLNKDKTVALNIARGAVTYIEKQNFQYMKKYLDDQLLQSPISEDIKGKFVSLNGDSCVETIEIVKNGSTYSFDLFQEETSCSLVLIPEINGRVYNTEDYFLTVKLRPTPLLPSGLKDPLTQYLLHFDVEVNWGNSNPIIIEGVISDESL